MGLCCAKSAPASGRVDGSVTPPPDSRQTPFNSVNGAVKPSSVRNTPARSSSHSPWPSPYPHGGAGSPLPAGVSPSPARSSAITPCRFFRRPFPPPSPAKHIKAALAKRRGPPVPAEGPIPEEANDAEQPLDKSFGYGKNFSARYELGKEVGRGHFGHTCMARAKKGEIKGQLVAVKIVSKAKVRWCI
ncbi:Cyclin-dependent kinase 4 [Asimina triloba]